MSCSPSLTKQPNYSYNKHWYNKSSSKYMLQWMWLYCSKVRLLHRCIALARFACTLLHARNWSLVSRIWQPCFFFSLTKPPVHLWFVLRFFCTNSSSSEVYRLVFCKKWKEVFGSQPRFSADKSTRTSAICVSILALIQAFHKYRPIFR